MFIGHNAVGFASKKVAPATSLLLLMGAPMLLDLLWPVFLLLGIEHVRIQPGATRLTPLDFYDYPWSHSLLMAVVWSLASGVTYFLFTRYKRGALVLGAGVLSHWLLDFLTHRADLPLWPGGPKVGLGMWNLPLAEIGTEAALFAIGIAVYRSVTRPRDLVGNVAFWAFVLFLAAVFIVNAGGTPPPNVRVLAWVALSMWILPLWAGWFDRHRDVVPQ
ncbi:MAG TPA: metal-dependent hydrolase [Thermoanaerobaculia bacterium]|nr:metal-dependent hydrolase [Thermoanaerobaculia bacterium]